MLIGSDATALFQSLSKDRTAAAVYRQAKKTKKNWSNIDEKWLTLYVHHNRHLSSNISEVAHLLPFKRPHKRGRMPGMSSFVCMQCYLEDDYEVNGRIVKNSWIWPDKKLTKEDLKILMAIMLEISVKFFLITSFICLKERNFCNVGGGGIEARLTMCNSRLTMQDWWEDFIKILEKSNLKYLLSALYVDDGRIVMELLRKGVRFDINDKVFKFSEE